MGTKSKKVWAVKRINSLGKIGLIALVIPLVFSGTEYAWFLRWMGKMTVYTLLVAVCLVPLYGYLIAKKPFFEIALSKRKKTYSHGEKIFGHACFWLLSFLSLFFAYLFLFPLTRDTASAIANGFSIVEEKEIITEEVGTYIGLWILGQSIRTVSGEHFELFASPKPLARQRVYTIRYLPYSHTIIDFKEVSEKEGN